MSTLNISDKVCGYVETKLNLPFTISIDILNDAKDDAACIRHDPAPAAEERYIDGTRRVKWNLSFYIRNKKRDKAREYANDIARALDGVEIVDNEMGVVIFGEAQTLPQFINVDEKNNSIYCVAIVCEYLEPREEE